MQTCFVSDTLDRVAGRDVFVCTEDSGEYLVVWDHPVIAHLHLLTSYLELVDFASVDFGIQGILFCWTVMKSSLMHGDFVLLSNWRTVLFLFSHSSLMFFDPVLLCERPDFWHQVCPLHLQCNGRSNP